MQFSRARRARSEMKPGRRKAVSWFGVVFSTAALMIVFSAPTYAVHDTGAFQLDGDASSSTQPAPPYPQATDDWDKVCHQYSGAANPDTLCSTTQNTSGSTAGLWTCDKSLNATTSCTSNATIFTGGGSKDPQDVNQWAWKDGAGGLPDKDNLVHAFAARYSLAPSATCPSNGAATCEVIFFGLDRFDNSGDAQNGFWFLQNKVGLGTNAVGGGSGFVGTHRAGDVLVVSDFSNGGGTSTITVYTWDPTCTATNKPFSYCGDANLHTQETSTNAKCSTALAGGDAFCGIVNPTNGTISPWSADYTDKSGNHSYLNGEFYEAGINLSAFGLGSECFSSMVAESRSSTSTTATLKDFVLGGFGKCESTLETTAKDGSGGTIPAGGLSIGTGSVSGRDSANLSVNGLGIWSGTLSFYLCGPSASDDCAAGGTLVSSGPVTNSTPKPVLSAAATVTSAGRYCWRGVFTSGTNGVPDASDNGTNPNECFIVNPVQPALATSAGAGPVLLGSPVSDTATLSGAASQPGSPVINGPLGPAAGGSITFTLYGPDNCTTVATGTGSNPQTVGVSGNGTYGPVSFTPNHVGTYHWVASYSGNSPNTLATDHNTACNDTGEDVVVQTLPTTTVTNPIDADGNTIGTVSFGASVRDHAVVTGAAAGGTPTGTVTFYVCDPSQTSGAAGSEVCAAGTQVGSPVTATAIPLSNPPQSEATSAAISANKTGVWCFRAVYTPDTTFYLGSGDATHGECFLVTDSTSSTTAQKWLPNDSGTVTSGGSPLNGNASLTLYSDGTCGADGGTALYTTSQSINGGTTATINSNNTTVFTSNATVSWKFVYTSNDPNVTGTSHCEVSTLTVQN